MDDFVPHRIVWLFRAAARAGRRRRVHKLAGSLAIAVLALLCSFSEGRADRHILLKEDFTADLDRWRAIKMGSGLAPQSVLNPAALAEEKGPKATLQVKGTEIHPAVGVAVLFDYVVLKRPGMKLTLRFEIRPNRVEGFGGVGGNAVFFGFLGYSGERPSGDDDNGYFSVARAKVRPFVVSDSDPGLSFLSSGGKQWAGADVVEMAAGRWVSAEMEIERTDSGLTVHSRLGASHFSAEYFSGDGKLQESFSSVVICQGGGGEFPADFEIRDLEVELNH